MSATIESAHKQTHSNKGLVATWIDSLAQIPAEQWDGGMNLPTPMQHNILKVTEQSGINSIHCRYLKLNRGSNDIGRANLFASTTDFSTFDQNLTPQARSTIKRWFPEFMTFRMLECGFFTMIGEGLHVHDDNEFTHALECLTDVMDTAAEEQGCDFILFRDIPFRRYQEYRSVLREHGYYPLLGFPNMAMDIRWQTLDEYLASLDSKTRLKFKHSRKLKEKFGVDVEVVSDYSAMTPELAQLWDNVHQNAKDYSREILDERFFRHCARDLQHNSEIITFTHKGKLIAFMLNIYDGDNYIVLDWGVDYSFTHYREANLYRAATLACLQRAIELKKSRMELGITNYTPKLTLGAKIEPMVYFIKHRTNARYSKTMARLLASNITQPDSTTHSASQKLNEAHVDVASLETIIQKDQCDLASSDIFQKADKYHRIDSMRLAGIYGLYPEFNSAQDSSITFSDGRNVVLLGTNSYLGLSTHPEVIAAMSSAIQRYGSGCSGSPLLNGTLDIHKQLENELAAFLGREAVLLCSTGFQTNLTGISALCSPGDLVLMDARNHRSLFDGVRLSGADYLVYRHNDINHLQKLLQRTQGKRRVIVTDTLFSMEGTIANLPAICKLSHKYDVRLYADESHALGVLGQNGRGVCELQGVEKHIDLIMGTFSKSFASLGGFIAGNSDIIDYIKHNGSGHIFSASLPAVVVETVRTALRIIQREPERRQDILKKASYMASSLKQLGYDAHYNGSQIVPITLGNYNLALAGYRRLMDHNVYVNPIGPPAVPEHEAGFRTSYMATHKWSDLDRALGIFENHANDFIHRHV